MLLDSPHQLKWHSSVNPRLCFALNMVIGHNEHPVSLMFGLNSVGQAVGRRQANRSA